MINRILQALFLSILFVACNTESRPTDAIGVGREFIDASLKGEYDKARKYVLVDSLNMSYFEQLQNFYARMPDNEKNGYKSANIVINQVENISDSVAIIYYSNTFKKEPAKIKTIRIGKDWWIDFKYSFSGNL